MPVCIDYLYYASVVVSASVFLSLLFSSITYTDSLNEDVCLGVFVFVTHSMLDLVCLRIYFTVLL